MNTHTIIPRNKIGAVLQTYRGQGKKIVFTNGCFDILHLGHVSYLEKAKTLGDILIVGINSDRSASLLKGLKRPIIGQNERAKIVASLYCVDHVVIFDEDTPMQLIAEIEPNIHTKGGDYDIKKLPEYSLVRSYGGKVKIIRYIDGKSTTNIIRRILDIYGKAAEKI